MGGQPEPPARPLPARPAPADFEELTAQAEELVAESTGLRSASGPARARVTDRAGWVHANVSSFQRLVGPHLDRLDPTRLSAGQQGHRAPGRPPGLRRTGGHRHPDGPGPRLALHPGARPVRPAADRGGRRGPGPRVLRGPQRGGPRAAARLRAPRVPAVAGPPRGDPPLPVHGHPLDARLLRLAGRRGDRLARARPVPVRRGAQAHDRGDPGRSQPAARQRRPRAGGHARAARGPAPDPGADEPARGARRRDHGPGRRRRHPQRGPVQRGAAPAPQADPGPGPAAPAADRDRGQAPPVRGGRAVHRRGGGLGRPRAARPGLARARNGCRPWSRSATRRNGSPVSAPRPPSPADARRRPPRRPGGRRAARPVHVPPRRIRADLRGLGGRGLPGPAGAGRGRRVPGHRRPRGPRAAPRVSRRGRGGVRPPPGGSAPGSAPSGWRWGTGPTWRPGPGPPGAASSGPVPPPATPPTTRPRRCWPTCCGGPVSTAWPACGPAPTHPLLGLRRSETVALCRPPRPRPGPTTRPTTIPGSSGTGSATSSLPLCSDIAGRDVVPVLARQAAVLAGDAELLDAVAGLVDPADARRLAAAPGAGRRVGASGPG